MEKLMKSLRYGVVLVIFFSQSTIFSQQFAFPTAFGDGAYASGGRGGAVIHVTNLNDNGPGSFRDALLTQEPRTIIFDVSGVINLQSVIYSDNPNIGNVTINGFSAPLGGITIIGSQIKLFNIDNMIWRGIRFRNGYKIPESPLFLNSTCLDLRECNDVIIDKCSFSYGKSKGLSNSTSGPGEYADNITFQNNLFGNSQQAMLVGNSDGEEYGGTTIYRNVMSNVGWRQPKGGGAIKLDVINNISSNWQGRTIRMDDYNFRLNLIGNYYQGGGVTNASIRTDKALFALWTNNLNNSPLIYDYDNFIDDEIRPLNYPNDPTSAWFPFISEVNPIESSWFVQNQLQIQGRVMPILDSSELKTEILSQVGACNYIDDNGEIQIFRDEIDQVLIENVENNNAGGHINPNDYISLAESLVNSIPNNVRPTSFYISNPHIPEVYLDSRGITGNAIIHNQLQPSGYTLLEEYLNQVDSVFSDALQASAGIDQSICEGDTATLTVTTNSGTNFLWSTGETTQSIEVTPTTTTTYTVTVSDAQGNTVEDTVEIIVNTLPTADAGIDETICQGESVVLSATGGSSYLWSTGATSATIEVSPITTTDYSVEVFNGNCSDIDIVTVSVTSAPEISTSGDITIVEGDSVTLTVTGSDNYLWSTGETTASITVSPIETTIYTVTSININNCSTTAEILVEVVPVFEVSAGADQRICDQGGDQVVLTASNADTYLWSTGETSQSIVVSPSTSTTYEVTATLGNQEDTASVMVYVDPNPNVTIINGDSADILLGEFITLSATGANTYEWSNGATQPNIAVSPSQTTTFQVRGYINDCYEEEEITVNVYQQVNAYAGEDVTICLDDSIVLTATGGDEYLWSTGETTQSIEVTPQVTTEYTVTVFNAIDFDEASVIVEVDTGCEETVVEPGENPTEFNFKVYPVPAVDYFTIDISGMSDDAELFLYDITGKLMIKEVLLSDNNYYSFSKDINVSNIRSGIYFLHLIEVNNPNPEILKLIIN